MTGSRAAAGHGKTPHSGFAERHGSQLRRAAEAEAEARAKLDAAEARARELEAKLEAALKGAAEAQALREEVSGLKVERQDLVRRVEAEVFARKKAEDTTAATGASLEASEVAYAALQEEHRTLRSTKIRRDHKADRLHEKAGELAGKLEEQTKLRERREEELAGLEERMRVIRRKNEALERSVTREKALREDAGREMQIKEEECRLMAKIIRNRAEEDRARMLTEAEAEAEAEAAAAAAAASRGSPAGPLGGSRAMPGSPLLGAAPVSTRRDLEQAFGPADFSFADSLPTISGGLDPPPVETIDLPAAVSDAELRRALDEDGLEGIAADPEMEALVEASEAADGGPAAAAAAAARRDSLI